MPTAEVMIGLDPHKASNTIAVLDRSETILNRRRFDHDEHGLETMLTAVAAWPQRVWAVEGGHGTGRNIAQLLVAAGETVLDVPAKLASRVRVYSDRTRQQDRRHRRRRGCACRAAQPQPYAR